MGCDANDIDSDDGQERTRRERLRTKMKRRREEDNNEQRNEGRGRERRTDEASTYLLCFAGRVDVLMFASLQVNRGVGERVDVVARDPITTKTVPSLDRLTINWFSEHLPRE